MWNLEQDPFLRYSSTRFADVVTDGFVRGLDSAGLDAFSMAALARWMGVTPAAVAQRARKPVAIRMIVGAMASRLVRWSGPRSWPSSRPGSGPVPLPVTEAERLGVRAWLLAGELARSRAAAGDDGPAELCVAAIAEERAGYEAWWGSQTPRVGFEEFWVVLQGLRLHLAFEDAFRPRRSDGPDEGGPDRASVLAAERVLADLLNVK